VPARTRSDAVVGSKGVAPGELETAFPKVSVWSCLVHLVRLADLASPATTSNAVRRGA
jgi:hypothetical protein